MAKFVKFNDPTQKEPVLICPDHVIALRTNGGDLKSTQVYCTYGPPIIVDGNYDDVAKQLA